MSWNYRVVQMDYDSGESVFTIAEVYYNESSEPMLHSAKPDFPFGYTLEELRQDIELFQRALDKPILNRKDLP